MGAPNTLGTPNVDDYVLGRGIVYIADLTAGVPGPWRDLGNAPAFAVNNETETLEHKSSRSGLAVVDKEVTLSRKSAISFQLDEINAENLAEFFSGEKDSVTNPGVAGVAEQVAKYVNVELGRWYRLTTSAGVPIMDVPVANLTLEKDGAPDVALVENTDFVYDQAGGRFFLMSTAVNIAAGDSANITIAATAGAAATIRKVNFLTQTERLVAICFQCENPANNGKKGWYYFWKVSLKSDGDYSLIADDWATLGFSGALQSNLVADPDSPYATFYEHANS